ncbi:MAG: protein kinase [Planctomycetes bacterium]|nr:protein kinase [Planctomycetota bacterium]
MMRNRESSGERSAAFGEAEGGAADDDSEIPVGSVVAGKYRVVDMLGRGGFGTVLLVEMVSGLVDERLAMKVLRAKFSEQPASREQFLQEIRVAMRLINKHIVQIRDVGLTDDGRVYYTMDHVQGKSLAQILRHEGKLAPERALLIVRRILHALITAHGAGVVHCDLKPANVMIEDPGQKDAVYVLDFGLATVCGHDAALAGSFAGTPHYMAPERFQGESIGFETDLYAVGVILYECLTGRRPYEGRTTQEVYENLRAGRRTALEALAPEVSRYPGLSDLMRRAIKRDRSRRLGSAREFFDEIGRMLTEPPTPSGAAAAVPGEAREGRAPRRALRARQPRGGRLWAAAAGLLLVAAAAVWVSKDLRGIASPARLARGPSAVQPAPDRPPKDSVNAPVPATTRSPLAHEAAQEPARRSLVVPAPEPAGAEADPLALKVREAGRYLEAGDCKAAALAFVQILKQDPERGGAAAKLQAAVECLARPHLEKGAHEQAYRLGLESLRALIEVPGDLGPLKSLVKAWGDRTLEKALTLKSPVDGSILSTGRVPVVASLDLDCDCQLEARVWLDDQEVQTARLEAREIERELAVHGDGVHTVRVELRAELGAELRGSPVKFTVDTEPPALEVNEPTEGQDLVSPVHVRGTVRDRTPVEVTVAAGDTDPVAANLAGESWSVALRLAPGKHPLAIRAKDSAGHTAMKELRVRVLSPEEAYEALFDRPVRDAKKSRGAAGASRKLDLARRVLRHLRTETASLKKARDDAYDLVEEAGLTDDAKRLVLEEIRALEQAGDERLASGEPSSAAGLYGLAARLGALWWLEDADALGRKEKRAQEVAKALSEAERLERELARLADKDRSKARRLVLLYLRELDDPAAANAHRELLEEKLQRVIGLAARGVQRLTAPEARELGEWYREQAGRETEDWLKEALLRRAVAIFELPLFRASEDLDSKKARELLAQARDQLERIEKARWLRQGLWYGLLRSEDDLHRWTHPLTVTTTYEAGARTISLSGDGWYSRALGVENLVVRARVRKHSGQGVGLHARVSADGNYSVWFKGGDSFRVQAWTRRRGPLALADFKLKNGQRYDREFELTLAVIGDSIHVFADGERIWSGKDDTVRGAGGASLGIHRGSWPSGRSDFRDVEVLVPDAGQARIFLGSPNKLPRPATAR